MAKIGAISRESWFHWNDKDKNKKRLRLIHVLLHSASTKQTVENTATEPIIDCKEKSYLNFFIHGNYSVIIEQFT